MKNAVFLRTWLAVITIMIIAAITAGTKHVQAGPQRTAEESAGVSVQNRQKVDEDLHGSVERYQPTKSYVHSLIVQELDTAGIDTITVDSIRIHHGPFRTKWNSDSAIPVFYTAEIVEKRVMDTYVDHSFYSVVLGFVYVHTGPSADYRRFLIECILPQGGPPSIESVFYANADVDSLKELVVLVSWEQAHHVDFAGRLFDVLIYDDIAAADTEKLAFLHTVSNRIGPQCDCRWSNGTVKTADIINRDKIIEKLRRIGY